MGKKAQRVWLTPSRRRSEKRGHAKYGKFMLKIKSISLLGLTWRPLMAGRTSLYHRSQTRVANHKSHHVPGQGMQGYEKVMREKGVPRACPCRGYNGVGRRGVAGDYRCSRHSRQERRRAEEEETDATRCTCAKPRSRKSADSCCLS